MATASTVTSTTGRSISLLPWWTITFLSLTAFALGSFAAFTEFAFWSLTSFAVLSTLSTTSTATSTSGILVSKGEVDIKLLLSVGSLEVDNPLFLLFLTLLFIFLLVDGGLLPLRVNVRAFSSLSQVELGSFLLLGSLPFVQGECLHFLLNRLLVLSTFLLDFSLSRSFTLNRCGFFNRGVVGSLISFLGIILEGSPVTLSTSSTLILSLDASSAISRFPLIFPLSTTSSFKSSSSSSILPLPPPSPLPL